MDRFVVLNQTMSTPRALPMRFAGKPAHGPMPKELQPLNLPYAASWVAMNQKARRFKDSALRNTQSWVLRPASCRDVFGVKACLRPMGRCAKTACRCRRMSRKRGISNVRALFGENLNESGKTDGRLGRQQRSRGYSKYHTHLMSRPTRTHFEKV